MILDRLRAGCDEQEGAQWTAAIDSTVGVLISTPPVPGHAPPADIDPGRLAPVQLSRPARTGGRIE